MVMKTTIGKKDLYATINDMILQKLEQGIAPWKQTWNDFGPARNYLNKKAYRGINALLLNNMDYEYPLYLTFLQVKELGGSILALTYFRLAMLCLVKRLRHKRPLPTACLPIIPFPV
jgi:antirestriction protein ArdC